MSPAVFQSPSTSANQSQAMQPPPSFPNSNPNSNEPTNFSSFVSSLNNSTTFNSLNTGTISDEAKTTSFSLNSRSRSRPRLVKMRKRLGSQHVRYKSVSDNSNGLKDNKLGSSEFFQLNNVCSDALNFKMGSDCGKNVNFVFDDKSNLVLKGEKSNLDGPGKFNNISSVFENSNKSNLNLGDRESGGKVGSLDFEGFTKFSKMEFSCGSNMAKSPSRSNLEGRRERCKNGVRYYDERKKAEEEMKSELPKVDNFVFGAIGQESMSDPNLEKRRQNGSFVFGAGGNDLKSFMHSERVEDSMDLGKSYASENENTTSTSQARNLDNINFVFGTNKSDSTSIADTKTGESRGKAEIFVNLGKMNMSSETEHKNPKVNGVFLFGSGSKGRSHGSSQLGGKISKMNIEQTGNCKVDLKREGYSTDFIGDDKFNFVFGGSSSGLGNGFSKTHAFKLSDEIQKMNIHDSVKVDGVEANKDSNTSLFANFNGKFVIGSDKHTSASSSCSSGFTCHQYQDDANAAGPENGTVVENVDEVDLKTSQEKVFAFGNKEKNANSVGGSDATRIRDTRFGAGLFACQSIPRSSFSEIFGKETQAINLTEKSMAGGQLNPDTEVNKPSFASSSSLKGFGSQSFESVYGAPSGERVEKKHEEFFFTSTPVQPGASFTGFSTPTLNTPANFFPGLSKKLEFSVSTRSAGGRRLKKTRGKLKKHTLVKNSQQNEGSPVCGSPMDFSPYGDSSCEAFASLPTTSTEAAHEVSAPATERSVSNSRTERVSANVSAGVASAEAGAFRFNTEREENDAKSQPRFTSSSQNHVDGRFSSSSARNSLLASKRQSRKKYKLKIGGDSGSNTSNVEFASSSFKYFDKACTASESDKLNTQWVRTSRADEKQVKHDPTETATLEACEKLRNRGNQAYRKGSLLKAESLYTKCIDSILDAQVPECCIEGLVLCYSNRAATRLSVGRMRESLADCKRAASLDSNFLKVQMRAANIHLVLGEVEEAMKYFNKCLQSGVDVCLDRRIMMEAADGLQKSQMVVKYTDQCAELLQERTSGAASNALRIIGEALSISCYSENLLEMKGQALCMMGKYEEVVQLCEQTIGFAKKNLAAVNNLDVRVWRWSLMSKSYFHMGRLEEALDIINQQQQLRSIEDKYGSEDKDPSITLSATVHELLHLKNEGNKAFKSGKHTEAVEHYTAAISRGIESHPFAAVCFCNRAAAHQALGKISDAIADCSVAISLDGSYAKALSRRATLHEMIRDYEQVVNDLQILVSVLQKQSQETHLRQARDRLSSLERKAKRGTPLDFYLILGIKASDTASDIKKAYHKAALKHHPDKAGQFLARSDNGDEGQVRKEITDKIHKDADRLFKTIGEAYAVLSDKTKRSTYDLEEEMRNMKDNNKSSSRFGKESNFYSSPFESSSSSSREYGREWTYGSRESWKTYGGTRSHSRW